MDTKTIHHPPILLKISPALIISVDVLKPDSIRTAIQRLTTAEACSEASNQVQLHARSYAELSNRSFVFGAALWSWHRAMVHQKANRFSQANEHLERYTADLRNLGVI